MPRKHREEIAGGVHHVYARGNGRHHIYIDDTDRKRYLTMLKNVVVRKRWRCLAYCLMDNHVHLLVETPEGNLGPGMQRLHGIYAQTFNQRHGRSGHVFQGRYGAVRIKDDEHLWTVTGYIALNPVKAGFCDRPEQWRWSSHAAVVDGSVPEWVDVARLLSYFEALGGDPWRRYLDTVTDRLVTVGADSPADTATAATRMS
jgi:REP element-mobilizing transposase RayT